MKERKTRTRQPALTTAIPTPTLSVAGAGDSDTRPLSSGQADAPSSEVVDRLTLPLKKDGTIALDTLRTSTKDKLATALKDPSLGSITGQTHATNDALDEALFSVLFDASSSLLVLLGRRAGYSTEQASVLAFTREETQMLTPLTAKVVNKWMPAGKYQDEIALSVALVAILSGKLALLRKTAKITPMPVPDRAENPPADFEVVTQ